MADINSFVQQNYAAAAKAADQLGTTPENVLGHWGLETGWGHSVIPGTNNMGNIKSTNGQGVPAVDNQLHTTSTYAAYPTPEAGADGYTKLMSNARYAGAQGTQDPQKFATGLKAGGYAEDPQYVSKLTGAIDAVHKATGEPTLTQKKDILANQVTEDYKNGVPPLTIVTGLLKSKVAGADVQAALQKGVDPTKIVGVVGGAPLAQFKATDPGEKVKAQGFLTNAGQGASNAVGDMALGAQQLVTTDPQKTAALQAQAQANEADPARQALRNTVGGNVGSFGVNALPALAAGVATGGAALPMIAGQAAAGALSGALQPTTADGQRTSNVLTEGALGGAGGAGGVLLGKGASAAAKMLRPNAAAVADATSVKAARDALGWQSTAADLNPTARSLRDAIPSAKAASEEQMQRDLAKTVLSRVGQTGDSLSTENVALARSTIYNDADHLLQGVQIPADTSVIAPKLQGIVSKYEADTLPTYRSTEVAGAAKDVLDKISTGEMSGQALVQARKNIAANAWKADGDTKTALRAITEAIDQHISTIDPNIGPTLAKANDQWRHLQVIENALNRVNGQGDALTPTKFAQSVKAVNRDQFQAGNAPYQDIADTLLKSQGLNASSGLAGLAAKTLSKSSDGLLTGAALFDPVHAGTALLAKKAAGALLQKAINSNNPAVVRTLSGVGSKELDPTIKAYIAKALGTAGGVTAAELN